MSSFTKNIDEIELRFLKFRLLRLLKVYYHTIYNIHINILYTILLLFKIHALNFVFKCSTFCFCI